MRAILVLVNEDSELRNVTAPTLACYPNGDDSGAGGAPIVYQQHSNEGFQTSRDGTLVADDVLELAIAIQTLGVTGQTILASLLIRPYCVVLVSSVTR
jgi:hypothetical protein